MNEHSNAPIFDAPKEQFYQVWMKGLTKPNEQTYAEIANSPDANPNKAYLWVFLTGLISFLFVTIAVTLGGASSQYGDIGSMLGGTAITLLCAAPIGAALGVLGFAINAAIVQWVAGLFKGTGNYSQLVYAIASFSAPISLVSGVVASLSVIPYIGMCFSVLSFAISIYTIVLMVMAVKGVNKFGWGEAIGSVLLPGLVIGILCFCIVFGSLMLLGPVIGNVFSSMSY